MKTIAVILPINNPNILRQVDLKPYQSNECFFELHYINTELKELVTAEDVALVSNLTLEKIKSVAESGTSGVVVYAFGEFGFEKKLQEQLSIPVLTLGAQSILEASRLSHKKFTILPGMISHNEYLKEFVAGIKLKKNNYQAAKKSTEVSPAQIRSDANMTEKLYQLACREIEENDIDCFTLGCGSFIGFSKPLEDLLQHKFGKCIHVVDPVETAFNFAKSQIILSPMLCEKRIHIPAQNNKPATNLYCKIMQKENATLGSRPVMLLVPGGPGGNHTVYLPIANFLLKFADLVFFDPRGCGFSDPSDAHYCTIDDYIDDIEAIRAHFDLDNMILLGGSYGAMAALGYAIRYPDHLEKLILLGGSPNYKFLETAKKNLERRGTDEQKAIAKKLWNGEFQDAKEFSDYYKIMAPLYSVNTTAAPPTTSSGVPYNIEVTNLGFKTFLRKFNFENEMEKITCPTLIISGSDDWINDPSHAKLMAEKIPESTLHIFDHCGHFVEDDQPGLFFSAMDDFLAK